MSGSGWLESFSAAQVTDGTPMKGMRHAPNKIVRKHMGADPPLGEGKYLAGVPTCTGTWSRQSLHAALVARERIES